MYFWQIGYMNIKNFNQIIQLNSKENSKLIFEFNLTLKTRDEQT